MKTEELIQTFDLKDEVEAFIKRRARDLAAEKTTFSFSGHPSHCGSAEPHIPHTTKSYKTVRHGWLQYFCAGESGLTDGGLLTIVIESSYGGSAESPGSAQGFWMIEEKA